MKSDKPWINEPDHSEFDYRGFPCIINRNPIGALCGYVGISPEHHFHGKDYKELHIEVHGGLTYAGFCNQSDNIWWLGFDCAHCFDYIPKLDDEIYKNKIKDFVSQINPILDKALNDSYDLISRIYMNKTYKNIAYVKNQIRHLVKQLQKAS